MPTHAAGERRGQPFEQKLQQDLAAFRAERLAHADLARPLLHVDEHDVHDADAADRQRQHADEREHDLAGRRRCRRRSRCDFAEPNMLSARSSAGL